MRRMKCITALIAVFINFNLATAEIPKTINFQGFLTDDQKIPIEGIVSITFSIYDSPIGTLSLWTETHPSVPVDSGIVNVILGKINSLTTGILDGQRYFGIKVNSDAEMLPRQEITSVPYAVMANSVAAGSVKTESLSDNSVTTQKIDSNSITSSKIANYAVDGSKIAEKSITTFNIQDGSGSNLNADLLDGMHASAFAAIAHTHNEEYYSKNVADSRFVNGNGDTIEGSVPNPHNIPAEDLLGVLNIRNTSNGPGMHVYALGGGTAITARSVGFDAAILGVADGMGTSAVTGWARGNNAFGVRASASGSNGIGIYAESTTTSTAAVFTNNGFSGTWAPRSGVLYSENANGSDPAGNFYSTGNGGCLSGVYSHVDPIDEPFCGSDTGYGGFAGKFVTSTQNGVAVYGEASRADAFETYSNYGGYFIAKGPYGIGVKGVTTGIYGYAGYFEGNVRVWGDLQVIGGSKSFVQDHPYDNSKQIFYVALEGGENGVYIRGSGQLKDGYAEIDLPEHFTLVAAETGLTGHLTPRDGQAKGYLYIEEVSPSLVKVKESGDGKSNAKFDFVIYGVRKGFEQHEVIRNKG